MWAPGKRGRCQGLKAKLGKNAQPKRGKDLRDDGTPGAMRSDNGRERV